ncbi:hypothetical protein [Sphingopyxis sp. GW247-27LB]|uniref:hypothetical protein n=1 Tax=Sphingopyxis sp. GW247-27LB TaxID=2012632 RepID=UPI000BA71067|nr:hypothetical protein [Sphingopyxis sp. GW247-27LB]PAL19764.1 hypothetical protein CD928_20460 [Sphingopyxis sp. GW247-27LB]
MKFILPLVAIAAFAAVPVQAQTKTADPHQHAAGEAAAGQPATPPAPKSGTAQPGHDHAAGPAAGGQGNQMMDGKCCCDEAKMRQMMSEMMPQMMRQMMGHGAQGGAGQQTGHADPAKP